MGERGKLNIHDLIRINLNYNLMRVAFCFLLSLPPLPVLFCLGWVAISTLTKIHKGIAMCLIPKTILIVFLTQNLLFPSHTNFNPLFYFVGSFSSLIMTFVCYFLRHFNLKCIFFFNLLTFFCALLKLLVIEQIRLQSNSSLPLTFQT